MNDRTDKRVLFDLHIENGQRIGRERQLTFAEVEPGGPDHQQAVSAEPVSRVVTPDPWERNLDWQQDFGYVSREQQFVRKAKELETADVDSAEFVPFQTYWPTYDQMQPRQLKWFLFWRKEVRAGRYPDTDLSYLFVYLYELIHGIGWAEPAEGYALMERVWRAYRQRHPKLDTYAREWLFDFTLVFDLGEMPTEPLHKLPRSLSPELKELEWKRRFTAEPLELSWELLLQLIDYEVEKSRFYAEQGRKYLRNYVPKVIGLVDGYLAKTKGSGMLGLFMPCEKKVIRYLFRSAVYDHELYGRTKTVSVLPVSESPPLCAYLTQLVRLTENKLRELTGYKGKLRGVSVEPEVERLVSRFLHKEFDSRRAEEAKALIPKVKINAAKLRQLQRESDEVRDMLLTEEPPFPPAKHREPQQAEIDFEREWPGFEEDQPRQQEPEEHMEQAELELMPPEEDVEQLELSEEWRELFLRFSEAHRKMLSALLHGEDAAVRYGIAEQAGSMPELLMDEINEIAMEWIGDLLIDGDEITEEYRSELSDMLNGSSR